MKGRFLVSSNINLVESNIYANKSSLLLDWLLRKGTQKKEFSLREVVNETGVSLGLAQRVFSILVLKGYLSIHGLRTAKKFFINKPKLLLNSWLDHYALPKKCKLRTYSSGFENKEQLQEVLIKSKLNQNVALALHSATEAYGCKNTNLDTLELYMLDLSKRERVEDVLQLEPREKGYEVLLIEPYYESLLNLNMRLYGKMKVSPPLLTFLDLYQFPLRGQEQAEFMAERIPELKRLYTQRQNHEI